MTEQLVGKFGDGERLAIIAICNLDVVSNKPYATHLQFAFNLAKDNPEFQFILFTPYRMSIANFRNMAAKAALETNADYLMFVDDDAVLINNEHLFKDLKDKIDEDENKHIIMPIVYIRGYPFAPMFFKWVTDTEVLKEGRGLDHYHDFKDQKVGEDGLLEVAAIGCHTCLIKTEVFRGITEPFFLTGLYNTEDVYFCMKCQDYIENIGIYVTTDITVSHLLDPLYVNEENVDILRRFYEELGMDANPQIKDFMNQPDQIKFELDELGEDFKK
jgi:hypothetical protein